MPQLPKTIRVGYQDVALISCDMGDDEHGSYTDRTARIIYNPARTEREIVNTILHECLHAIYHTSGVVRHSVFKDLNDEEIVAHATANALTQVFLDNPALLDWIKENLHNANVTL